MIPPVDGKFAAYGGPNFDIDAEVRGTVAALDKLEPGNKVFYLVPDPNYRHLLFEGNVRRPKERLLPWLQELGYDWYKTYIIANGFEDQPIIKLETYGIGLRPSSADESAGFPQVTDHGKRRDIKIGDRVSVRGLYVADYGHPMYYAHPTPSFCIYRGIQEIILAHAEIHPYRHNAVTLLEELSDTERLTERHLVAAPVYIGQWSGTWFVNGHLKSQLVDDLMRFAWTAEFTLTAPPKPSGEFMARLIVAHETNQGNGHLTYRTTSQAGGSVTVRIRVDARTVDVANPFVHAADYSIEWVPRPAGDRCRAISDELIQLENQRASYVHEREGYDTVHAYDRRQRGLIAQKIERIDKEAQRLREEARELGCSP